MDSHERNIDYSKQDPLQKAKYGWHQNQRNFLSCDFIRDLYTSHSTRHIDQGIMLSSRAQEHEKIPEGQSILTCVAMGCQDITFTAKDVKLL